MLRSKDPCPRGICGGQVWPPEHAKTVTFGKEISLVDSYFLCYDNRVLERELPE
jgi:hypothetical protein